jgi:hypothetical protein
MTCFVSCYFGWSSLIAWPPMWSSGQSSWLQIQRSGFDSQRYQIFWQVVGLGWGPLSLVSTTEELLERKSSGPSLESQEYGYRDPPRWPLQKLALTSPTSGGRSVGIVHSRTQATEFSFFLVLVWSHSGWGCCQKRAVIFCWGSENSPHSEPLVGLSFWSTGFKIFLFCMVVL